jgi:lipopolysaccharide biosynthesis glycosyltransferase
LTKVPVVFICDGHYVIPTAVAVTSLICNKKPDTYYDIYIITADLPETEMAKFYEFKGNKTDIHLIKGSLKKFEGLYKYGHVSHATYLKFELPDLIPDQDKVLYLDSDIIIQKDLTDLFTINIEDYYAGAAKDIKQIENHLNIKNYFNSGVMLLNLKLMRENNASAALLNIRKSLTKLKFMDQDSYNILFDQKVKFLPLIYNCFYILLLKNKDKYTPGYINECFGTNYSSLKNIKRDSYIIHLAGDDKPWIYSDNILGHEWDEYFRKSPFKFHKLKRKSIKPREFILSHNLTYLLYIFFKYWRDHSFKFAMGKVKKRLFKNKKDI